MKYHIFLTLDVRRSFLRISSKQSNSQSKFRSSTMLAAVVLAVIFLFQTAISGPSGFTPLSHCASHMQAALKGKYFDEHGTALAWANAASDTIIVDTNYIVALSKAAAKRADPGHIRFLHEVEALKRRMKANGITPRIAVSPETAHEATSIPGVKIPEGTTLVNSSVSKKPGGSYDTLLKELEKDGVGGHKGNSASDRQIVADAFFSKRTAATDVPKFATGDFGIIEPLCKKNPNCAKLLVNSNYSSAAVRAAFPTGFSVSITDLSRIVRTLTVVPL